MSKPNKRSIRTAAFVLLLSAFAVFLRGSGDTSNSSFVIDILRGSFYVSLFLTWGFSLRSRIIQTQARWFLTAIAALMVFWVAVRTVRYLFFIDTSIGRYIWYLYYFPMLFMPLLALLVALSIGKSEKFKLPKWTNLLFVVSILFLILVLTNDYHQFVFGLPKGLMFFKKTEFTHRLGYYIIMGWAFLCSVTAFIFIMMKCRVPYSKQRIFLPGIPYISLIIYAVLYVATPDFVQLVSGNMAVTSSILTLLSL